ncbi:MAG: nickel pincer cofactor biosynthesis protein LarC [Terriglobales bacterium]
MNRLGYIDCFSGISGDMMLGALVHAGVDAEIFRRTVQALELDVRIDVRAVERGGIGATKVDVVTAEGQVDNAHVVQKHSHHDHPHDHDHGHDHSHDHHHETHEHAHGRSLREIEKLISKAALPVAVRDLALRTFHLLGEAEATIHNIPVDEIHFHEVGAVDAIADISCAAAGCVELGVEQWLCSAINTGGGTVECAHGTLPVPAPATAELLKGYRTYNSGVNMELVTPTGAAILRALGCRFAPMPEVEIARIGYGAGTRDIRGLPNVVRITIGEQVEQAADSDTVTVLETAVDDLTPEIIGYVIEQSLAAGALDAMAAPVQMKKNRPGHLLTVLCRPEDAERMATLLLRETSALGLRMRQERRRVMQRRFETVSTPWGDVRVKIGSLNGEVANCAPEYEDCRRIAQEHGVPLKTVMQEAIRMCVAQSAHSAR